MTTAVFEVGKNVKENMWKRNTLKVESIVELHRVVGGGCCGGGNPEWKESSL